jgi:hypothetical protein
MRKLTCPLVGNKGFPLLLSLYRLRPHARSAFERSDSGVKAISVRWDGGLQMLLAHETNRSQETLALLLNECFESRRVFKGNLE